MDTGIDGRLPAAAREAGVQIDYHFHRTMPKSGVGLAFRRPWLVIGSSVGVAAAGLVIAVATWLLQRVGDDRDAVVLVMAIGIATSFAAGLVAVLIFFIVQQWRRCD